MIVNIRHKKHYIFNKDSILLKNKLLQEKKRKFSPVKKKKLLQDSRVLQKFHALINFFYKKF